MRIVERIAEKGRLTEPIVHGSLPEREFKLRWRGHFDLRYGHGQIVLQHHLLQREQHGGFRRYRGGLPRIIPEAHLIGCGVGIDADQQNFGGRFARQTLLAHRLERLAQQHVHHPLRWHARIDPDLNGKLLGAAGAAVIDDGIGGEEMIGDARPSPIVEREESAAPAQAADAAGDRILILQLQRHPIADGACVLVIHREAREDILDVGLQRHADGGRHTDAGGRDAGEGEAFLPPQGNRHADRDDEDRYEILHQPRRFAPAPLSDMAFPIETPAQPVDEDRNADDQRDGQETFDPVHMIRHVVPDRRLAEDPHHKQDHRHEEGEDHYFSVITRSVPLSPSRSRRM